MAASKSRAKMVRVIRLKQVQFTAVTLLRDVLRETRDMTKAVATWSSSLRAASAARKPSCIFLRKCFFVLTRVMMAIYKITYCPWKAVSLV